MSNYKGVKYELYDNKGNVIYSEDTRDLEKEKEKQIKMLNKFFEEDYIVKLGFDESEKPKGQRKIDQARLGILDDPIEAKMLLDRDIEIKAEYKRRKEAILNAKTCDEVLEGLCGPKYDT